VLSNNCETLFGNVAIVQMEQIPHAGSLSPPALSEVPHELMAQTLNERSEFSDCPCKAVPLRATSSESVPAWDFVPVCTKKLFLNKVSQLSYHNSQNFETEKFKLRIHG
jgi:hypothetical protein